jgi:phage replication O-like protein O
MANPQKEDGCTQIANDILDKLVASALNGTELAVCLFIIRKTYGWNKLEDEISITQFLKSIPVTRPSLCKALNTLQLVKIIKLVKKGDSRVCSNLWAFNKDYDSWQLVKKSKLVKISKLTSKDFEHQLVKKPLLTKDNIQKTITKDIKENIIKEKREIDGNNDKGKDVAFDSFLDFCQKKKVHPAIMIKKYTELREEYSGKVLWWEQVKGCVNWLSDKNLKVVNANRLRSRMDHAIKWNKEAEIKKAQERQDKPFLPPKLKTYKPEKLWTPPV